MQPPQNLNTEIEQVKDLKKVRHALIDVHFLSDDKIIEVGENFGELAQFFIIKILLLMSGTSGATISRVAARAVRGSMSKEEADAILDFCLNSDTQIFLPIDGDKLTNSRVLKDQASYGSTLKRKKTYRDNKRDVPLPSPSLEVAVPSGNGNGNGSRSLDLDLEMETGILKIGEFCHIDEISLDQFKSSKGSAFMDRCFELIDAWVGEVKADPLEFQRRKKRARNCSYLFKNWVFNRVHEELSRAKIRAPDDEILKKQNKERREKWAKSGDSENDKERNIKLT